MLWEAPLWVCFPHTVGATLLPAHPVGCSVVYRAPGTEDFHRHDHPHLNNFGSSHIVDTMVMVRPKIYPLR